MVVSGTKFGELRVEGGCHCINLGGGKGKLVDEGEEVREVGMVESIVIWV